MFEQVSGTKAELAGKPSALFYRMAVRHLNVPLNGIHCIGDDISTDVAGAKDAGLYAILVKTGKYRDFEPTMSHYKQPDEVLDDLNQLAHY
jgi:ribonucleotide monophosphatase NagD (HAD superfamily)